MSTKKDATIRSGDFFVVGGTGLEKHGRAAGGATNRPVDCWLVRGSQSSVMSNKKKQRQGITMEVVLCLLLCSPLYCAFQVNRCVRAYMAGTHVRRKNSGF